MVTPVRKYNPGFLTEDDLVNSFCVRTGEFESIVEALSENDGNASSHTIVIGPRGSGKTHLLLRVAIEMRREERIQGYFPIVFAEETYEVSTCGEFWLECLGRLAEQAPHGDRPNLRLTYEELSKVGDDGILEARCLGFLMDYADRHDRRLALVVENLNMLLPDMSDPNDGWKLRKTFQTEPRITILGSATSRFNEIDHRDQPLYDIFRTIALRSLDTDECSVLWSTVSGQPSEPGTVRPLQILTGGNPRMIAVVAGFRTTNSFNELMNNLLELIDDHTEYFKGHLDALPSQERRVYLALARLWKPAMTREIAEQARMDTNKCSAFLRRLVERGVVAFEGDRPRQRQYYLTERLYNIYYLLRRPSGEGQAVRALIQFMSSCYSPRQLLTLGIRIAREYEMSDAQFKQLQELAFRSLLELPEMQGMQEQLLMDAEVMSQFSSDGTPDIAGQIAILLHKRVSDLENDSNFEEAIDICSRVAHLFSRTRVTSIATIVMFCLVKKGILLKQIDRVDEAIATFDEATTTFYRWEDPIIAALVNIALVFKTFHSFGKDLVAEGNEILENGLWRFKDAWMNSPGANGLIMLSSGFARLGDLEGALKSLDRALMVCESVETVETADLIVWALGLKGHLLLRLNQAINGEEAELLLERLADIDEFPSDAINTLISFCAHVGPAHALKLIQKSPSSGFLLPLVTALQWELGEQPRVALEVEEVAKDIRDRLSGAVRGSR